LEIVLVSNATAMHCNCILPSVNQINSPVEGILFVIGIDVIIYLLYRLFRFHDRVSCLEEETSRSALA